MAKDDYDVIVYRVLVYLYACKKRRIIYEKDVFDKTVHRDVNNDYFSDVLQMMQEEDLIRGLNVIGTWQGDKIIVSDMGDLEITAKGIHYLEDNDKMKKVGQMLKDTVDTIAKLAGILMLS